MLATAYPSTFGRCDDIGIYIILGHNVGYRLKFAVVPACRDRACNGSITLLLIVDGALVDAYQVGKHVEVIGVVVAAIDIGLARSYYATGPPHLGERGIKCILPDTVDGVPYTCFLAFALHVSYHLIEIGCRCAHLIASYMYIRSVGKDLNHFVESGFQHLLSLLRLHAESHGTLKSITMARHVNLWNYDDTVLHGCLHHGPALLLGIIFPFMACHGSHTRKLGVRLDLETPSLILREVPMKSVHFEAR